MSPIKTVASQTPLPTVEDLDAILEEVARVEWRLLELLNGFTNSPPPYAPARYRLTLNNVVYLQGRIERSPGLADGDIGLVIAHLGADALPGGDLVFAVPTGEIRNLARLVVTADGNLVFGGLLISNNPAAAVLNLSQIVFSIEGAESFAVQAVEARRLVS